MIQSPLLSELPWLRHGFGTKAAPLSQDGMVSLQQIHSALVLPATLDEGWQGDGDALITNRTGITVSIRTADCLPILVVDTKQRAVAAVHAGWRGTAAGIVVETLTRMRADFGTNPADVFAAIGPGIGECCYQVGDEVSRQFGKSGTSFLDLAAENRKQLERARVASIDTLLHCTRCDDELFHSFRRDKEAAGRMISFVGVIDARLTL